MISIFGLPAPARYQSSGDSAFARISLANNFIPRESDREILLLDGESLRLETGFSKSFNDCWRGEIKIPFLHHSGGRLDSFVDQWHQFFSLPQSGRPKAPADRLLYFYRIGERTIIDLTEEKSGIGDIRLNLSRNPVCGAPPSLLLRTGIKLPTGDPDFLFGSGGGDFFLDVTDEYFDPDHRFSLFYTAGGLVMESVEIFPNARNIIAYGTGGLSWNFSPTFSLDSQLSFHTPFFHSDLRVLGEWSLQLVFGGRLKLSDRVQLEFAMSEDPIYGTSPDVVFHFGVLAELE